MPNNYTNLRIGHLNVCGLEAHIDGIKLLLDKTMYHLFAVSETKMKSSSPIGPVRVPGYNFVRHTLPSGRGRGSKSCGGIGLYVRKGLKATTLLKSTFCADIPISQRFEFLVVQIKVNELNIGAVIVYNPVVSNPSFPREYEKLLFDVQEFAFDRLFVLGDFNINVSAPVPAANCVALSRINDAFNLSVLPTPPTRITERSATTIDLLITDSPTSIVAAKTSTNSVSDHETIYLITNVRIERTTPHRIQIKDFRNVDIVRLQADFQEHDFQQARDTADIDMKAQIITTELQNLMQRHVPERTIEVRDKRTPWITSEIERAISVRDLAHALYLRNPNRNRNDAQWRDYQAKRDRAASLISAAKRRYGEKYFGIELPAKKLWCNLRREGVHNNTKKNVTCDEADPEALNRFFCDGHRPLLTNNGTADEPSHRTATDRGQLFNFDTTNPDEVAKKIMEIHTNAEGSDGIPISFVKMLMPFILPLLVHLFNAIIEAKIFPALWKKGLVTPIPKVPNPVNPKDFRPISVLPAISKIFEKILLDQIVNHVDNDNGCLLAANQSGYRKGFSTTTALAKVTHDIYHNLDDNRCTVMVLVDFSLAFNCVNHRLLGKKLHRDFKFSENACNLIASFLNGRTQAVKLGNIVSSELPMLDGTPQGSCLSALLFSLYINSLPLGLKCNYQLYADDLQIYLSGPVEEINGLVTSVNEDLQRIERWAKSNYLHPNPNKTQAIIFCKGNPTLLTPDIMFCGEKIELSDCVVNLGLKMDRNLKWTNQVNDVTCRVFNTLRTFRRFSPVLSVATRKKLVQSVIVPFFTYADVVYHAGLSAALKEQLQRCFKAAVRFTYNIRRRESTGAVINTILGHNLATNYHHRTCCFLRQGFDQKLPGYLQQHLQRGQQERARSFVVPRHSNSMRKSVLVAGAIKWNQLPLATRQSNTIAQFKLALRVSN